MARLDDAIARLSADIAQTGALTAEAARRYEEIFVNFRDEATRLLEQAADMTDAAAQMIALLEAASTGLQSSLPNQPHRDCRDGCAACCHLFVAIPPGMAALIAGFIRQNFAPADQALLMARLDHACAEIEQARTTTEIRTRCPLLGSDDRCTIYAVRPLSCRAFTSGSAAHCQQMVFGDAAQRSQSITQNPGHYRLHIDATEALQRDAARRGLSPAQKGFLHALRDQLLNPPIASSNAT